MVKEFPRDVYRAKPVKFGNGARLKAYKTHINKEMVIMTREKYNEYMKGTDAMKDITDEEADRDNSAMAKKWTKAEDRCTDKVTKDLKKTEIRK